MKKTKSNKVGLKNTQSIDNYEQSIKKRPNTDSSIHENTPTKKTKGILSLAMSLLCLTIVHIHRLAIHMNQSITNPHKSFILMVSQGFLHQ
ncbi:hypothetical protein [Legionella drancourtii]|uniref:hypothetical protein n=1 Tax=Legionella drancourtii TaxID=168933 RepID=UPI0011D241D7|nr:hypothetical protein [Legionella drancourtii]